MPSSIKDSIIISNPATESAFKRCEAIHQGPLITKLLIHRHKLYDIIRIMDINLTGSTLSLHNPTHSTLYCCVLVVISVSFDMLSATVELSGYTIEQNLFQNGMI